MTAPELSEDERAIVDRFEAAEYPPEVARAMGVNWAQRARTDLAAVLAADDRTHP